MVNDNLFEDVGITRENTLKLIDSLIAKGTIKMPKEKIMALLDKDSYKENIVTCKKGEG